MINYNVCRNIFKQFILQRLQEGANFMTIYQEIYDMFSTNHFVKFCNIFDSLDKENLFSKENYR